MPLRSFRRPHLILEINKRLTLFKLNLNNLWKCGTGQEEENTGLAKGEWRDQEKGGTRIKAGPGERRNQDA